jgi:hypothetical protein
MMFTGSARSGNHATSWDSADAAVAAVIAAKAAKTTSR